MDTHTSPVCPADFGGWLLHGLAMGWLIFATQQRGKWCIWAKGLFAYALA